MEIKVHKEDLKDVDCGGGYRDISAEIYVDSTLSLPLQIHALFYEILASYLEPLFSREAVLDIVDDLADGLNELENPENQTST